MLPWDRRAGQGSGASLVLGAEYSSAPLFLSLGANADMGNVCEAQPPPPLKLRDGNITILPWQVSCVCRW